MKFLETKRGFGFVYEGRLFEAWSDAVWARLVLRGPDGDVVTRFGGPIRVDCGILYILDPKGEIHCDLVLAESVAILTVSEIRTTDGYNLDIVCEPLYNGFVPVWASPAGEE